MPGETSRRIKISELLAPHWKTLTCGLLAALFCSLMDLAQPVPLKIVIDNVLNSKKLPTWLARIAPGISADPNALLNATAVSLVLIAVAGAIGGYIQSVLMTRAGQWVMHDLRTTLYHHIQRLSLSYY